MLSRMSVKDLQSLAQTVTSKLLEPQTKTEAISMIILHTERAADLLKRKKIKKELMFEYLDFKKVSIEPLASKNEHVSLVLNLWGSDESAPAKMLIEGITANEGQSRGGGGGGGVGGVPLGAGGGLFEMLIPGHKVGLVIGKGGETIKQIQEQTGATLIIIQDSNQQTEQKPMRITGTPESVERAKAEVFKILNQQVEYVMVASNKVGLVIGKGGETIKSIIQASGAHVEIDRIAPPEAVEKNFIIRGSTEAVERAKKMVLEKIGAFEVCVILLRF